MPGLTATVIITVIVAIFGICLIGFIGLPVTYAAQMGAMVVGVIATVIKLWPRN